MNRAAVKGDPPQMRGREGVETEVTSQILREPGVAELLELGEGPVLDLTDPLACDSESACDLFERARVLVP